MLRFSLSNAGDCPKKYAYKEMAEPRQKSNFFSEVNPRFLDGHWHEYEVKQRLCQSNVVFESGLGDEVECELVIAGSKRKGHWDGVVVVPAQDKDTIPRWLQYVPPGRYLLEVKSASSGMYQKFKKTDVRTVWPEYEAQVQCYLRSTPLGIIDSGPRSDENQLGLVAAYKALKEKYGQKKFDGTTPPAVLFLVKNKDTGDIRSLVITPDAAFFDELDERWSNAEEAWKSNNLPEKLYVKKNLKCRECPGVRDCWGEPDEPGNPNDPAFYTSEEMDASEQYALGKTLEDIGKKLKQEADVKLEDAAQGSLGFINIKRYKKKRRTFDSNLLQLYLTDEQWEKVQVWEESEVTRKDVTLTETEFRGILAKHQKDLLLAAPEEGE